MQAANDVKGVDILANTMQHFKQKMGKSRQNSHLKAYKKMATAEDLLNLHKVKPISKSGKKLVSNRLPLKQSFTGILSPRSNGGGRRS